MNREDPAFRPAVNTRRWTTKVNLAVVAAVFLLVAIGCIWAFQTFTRQEEVQEEMTEDLVEP
ncbi:MAG: hypothetical protein ACREIA_01045 [Opitutaceae bacterium]